MENTARLFNCARCHCQVVICSHCDRGNIYCGRRCAEHARKTSSRSAGKRYQRTYRGRIKHAERQRRYRALQNIVTHQRSASSPPNDSLPPHPEPAWECFDLEAVDGYEIGPEGEVNFRAQNSITLGPEFKIRIGGSFRAVIAP
jgi:hypothetical protein